MNSKTNGKLLKIHCFYFSHKLLWSINFLKLCIFWVLKQRFFSQFPFFSFPLRTFCWILRNILWFARERINECWRIFIHFILFLFNTEIITNLIIGRLRISFRFIFIFWRNILGRIITFWWPFFKRWYKFICRLYCF